MKSITVFTPTFNRAHLLPRLYNSLLKQTSNDFIWMVIDDGSTDNTKEIIQSWKEEGRIEIDYYYKENGGMHTGHNLAYHNITTELNICIDSDDYMPKDAIQKILTTWQQNERKDNIAGIIGLDADMNGNVIGTRLPDNIDQGSFQDIYHRYKVKGDKKIILRTKVVKEYPAYPEYPGEKLVPLGLLYIMIGNDYDYIYSNEIYCIVDYQPHGSSGTIFKQYRQSPRGFAYAKIMSKYYSNDFLYLCKNSIQIGSFAIFLKDYTLLNKGIKRAYNYILFPLGILLNYYIRFRIKKAK